MSVELLHSPSLNKASESGPNVFRLIRAEIAKIRSTNTWWLLALGIVAFTALTFTINAFGHHFELHPPAGACLLPPLVPRKSNSL